MSVNYSTSLISWLYELTNASSPAYNLFNFLIQTTIFLSVTAIFILLFKQIFKNKLSAKWHVLIWALLLIRFAVPVLPESPVSVFNAARVSEESVIQASYQVMADVSPVEYAEENIANNNSSEEDNKSLSQTQQSTVKANTGSGTILPIDFYVSVIWASGAGIMLIYFLIIYIICSGRLRKKRRDCDETTLNTLESCKSALRIKRNVRIYYADTSPMLMGVFRPVLYLPDTYSQSEERDVILHELCHMKNFDILLTMLATLVLCLNWFNPIIWISFFVFKRDIEVFCDERTLRYSADKQDYAKLLLKTATAHREKFVLGTTSLQSGKTDVKRRIKYMAFFKKPAVLTVVAAVIAVSVISACCLTNSINPKVPLTFKNPVTDSKIELYLDNSIIKPTYGEGDFFYFETDATMDEIYNSIANNNHNVKGIEELNEKELLLHFNEKYYPCILVSKNVKDTANNELDNILVLQCLGIETYAIPLHDESNMPHMKYNYCFPNYLINNCFVYNTKDKTVDFNGNKYPFYGEVKLIDSKYTNFSDIVNFYKGLRNYRLDIWGNDFTGGEILVQDDYSDLPLFSINYNEKNKTVKYQAYPALAAESAKSVIYKYFNAMKNHDTEAYLNCFENSGNYFKIESEFNNIRDLVLAYIIIKDYDNEKMEYTYDVVYDIAYGTEGSATHIESRFVVNFNDLTPVITHITDMYVEGEFVSTPPAIAYFDKVDLSDIDDNMNIGSEMTFLDYADYNKVIMSGTCGVVVYDLNQRKVSKRISDKDLKALGVEFPYAFSSKDGNTVYIRDAMEDFDGADSVNNTYKNYTFDVNSGALYEWEGLSFLDPDDIYQKESIYNSDEDQGGYADKYEKYLDKDKLISASVVERENDFVYLQCTTDWRVKNLQIVICNENTGKKEEIYVFK